MGWITSDDQRWLEFRLELAGVLANHDLFPEGWTFERAMASVPQKFYAFAAWLILGKSDKG